MYPAVASIPEGTSPSFSRKSLFAASEQEIERHKWINNQKAGRDLGDEAVREWVKTHWQGYLRAKWLEHLQGKCFWIELDRNDFGLLQHEFSVQKPLLNEIIRRLTAGQENLDIICWASEGALPLAPIIQTLQVLDISSRRLVHRFEALELNEYPQQPIKPDDIPPDNLEDAMTRAAQILDGNILPSHYLTIPTEVRHAVDTELNQFRKEQGTDASPEERRRLETEYALRHYFSDMEILTKRNTDGVIVLAAGDRQITAFLNRFPPERG